MAAVCGSRSPGGGTRSGGSDTGGCCAECRGGGECGAGGKEGVGGRVEKTSGGSSGRKYSGGSSSCVCTWEMSSAAVETWESRGAEAVSVPNWRYSVMRHTPLGLHPDSTYVCEKKASTELSIPWSARAGLHQRRATHNTHHRPSAAVRSCQCPSAPATSCAAPRLLTA